MIIVCLYILLINRTNAQCIDYANAVDKTSCFRYSTKDKLCCFISTENNINAKGLCLSYDKEKYDTYTPKNHSYKDINYILNCATHPKRPIDKELLQENFCHFNYPRIVKDCTDQSWNGKHCCYFNFGGQAGCYFPDDFTDGGNGLKNHRYNGLIPMICSSNFISYTISLLILIIFIIL